MRPTLFVEKMLRNQSWEVSGRTRLFAGLKFHLETQHGETRRKKWLIELADLTPEYNVKDFNYAALDLTMTVCVPGTPHCDECPIGAGLCVYGKGKRVQE